MTQTPRFSNVLRYEWGKSLATPVQRALLIASYAATIPMAYALYAAFPLLGDTAASWADLGTIISYIPALLFIPYLVLLNSGEWSTRSAITTFTLVPRRGWVLTAKALIALFHIVVYITLSCILAALVMSYGTPPEGVEVLWQFSWSATLQSVIPALAKYISAFLLGAAVMNTPVAIVLALAVPPMLSIGSLFGGLGERIILSFHLESTLSQLLTEPLTVAVVVSAVVATTAWLTIPAILGITRTLQREAA